MYVKTAIINFHVHGVLQVHWLCSNNLAHVHMYNLPFLLVNARYTVLLIDIDQVTYIRIIMLFYCKVDTYTMSHLSSILNFSEDTNVYLYHFESSEINKLLCYES